MPKHPLIITAAAVLILLLAGVGYWAYVQHQPRQTRPLVVPTEPPLGMLPEGQRLLVDDGSCPRGMIKEIVGGNRTTNVPRQRRCIPH